MTSESAVLAGPGLPHLGHSRRVKSGKQVSKMTKRAITIWWIEGLIAMIPKRDLMGFCALLLAAHPQGVSDGYGRTMVGFIV